jgi:acyl-coenzyme A thioesterase PaaI-like protein
MSAINAAWNQLHNKPLGKWLFSKIVCFKAPYFASINPRFVLLKPGYCEVTIRKRRSVQNHIQTVHAIAICNMAELAAGTMTDMSVPKNMRWIPKGMSVEYLKKAQTDLTAIAQVSPLSAFAQVGDLVVPVEVKDSNGNVVFRAAVTMYLSEKKSD